MKAAYIVSPADYQQYLSDIQQSNGISCYINNLMLNKYREWNGNWNGESICCTKYIQPLNYQYLSSKNCTYKGKKIYICITTESFNTLSYLILSYLILSYLILSYLSYIYIKLLNKRDETSN